MWLSRMYKCGYKEESIKNEIKSYFERYNVNFIESMKDIIQEAIKPIGIMKP